MVASKVEAVFRVTAAQDRSRSLKVTLKNFSTCSSQLRSDKEMFRYESESWLGKFTATVLSTDGHLQTNFQTLWVHTDKNKL